MRNTPKITIDEINNIIVNPFHFRIILASLFHNCCCYCFFFIIIILYNSNWNLNETFYILLLQITGVRSFYIFERSNFCSPRRHLFDQRYSILQNTVLLWNMITVWNKCFLCEYILNVFYSCHAKLNFQHHYSSVTWSFRNHSNMPICCSRNIYHLCQC